MPEDGNSPFPAWYHWDLLKSVENPSWHASPAAWDSLMKDVISVAARRYFD